MELVQIPLIGNLDVVEPPNEWNTLGFFLKNKPMYSPFDLLTIKILINLDQLTEVNVSLKEYFEHPHIAYAQSLTFIMLNVNNRVLNHSVIDWKMIGDNQTITFLKRISPYNFKL